MNSYPLIKNALFAFRSNKSQWPHNLLVALAHNCPHFFANFFPSRPSHCIPTSIKELDKYDILVGDNIWTFPIGLGSGLDRNAQLVPFLSRFYFGALEVGPISYQPFNDVNSEWMEKISESDSLKTLPCDSNFGVASIKSNLLKIGKTLPVGVSLACKKHCVNEITQTYNAMADIGDYFVLAPMPIENLKDVLQTLSIRKPLYIKISPDLNHKEIIELLHLVVDFQLTGVVATGATSAHPYGTGHVGGTYLRDKAKSIQSFILEVLKADRSIEVIGSGGVSRFIDLWNFWKEGGKVMQMFSSFVFQGPSILFKIKKELDDVLKYYHFNNVSQLLINIDSLEYPIPKRKRL